VAADIEFVDHHVHLLRVAAEGTIPHEPAPDPDFGSRVAAQHRRLAAAGTNPMDHLDPPAVARDELATRLQRGLAWARDLGLVEITEAGMAGWEYFDALRQLREQGPLPVRVKLLVASAFARPDMPRTGAADLDVIGVKFYADGWLGPRTCAVSHPFLDHSHDQPHDQLDNQPDDQGILFQDADTLARRAEPFAATGLTVATHAIGDRAIEAVLDAYEQVYGSDCAAAAPRIEHAQLLRPDLIDRIAAMGVVVCIQPSFAVTDAEARHVALGDQWPKAYAWNNLLAAGARVIAGSDFPIETLSPRDNFERLTTGRASGSADVVADPVPAEAALAMMTA
jgi:predicted amidohydrolase YtcJ